MFSQVNLYYYYGSITKDYWKYRHPMDSMEDFNQACKSRESFFKKLRNHGYTVRSKPVAMINKGRDGKEPKCNFDVEITIDVMDNLDNFDILVLCSGDGDFISLLKRVKGARKETYVIAPDLLEKK